MTYVVTEQCIRCKYQDCVEVCPVDAFREGVVMLAIDPDGCIDCGVCEPECPAEAILPDKLADAGWLEINARLARQWPLIRTKGRPPGDADAFAGMPDKFDKFFSDAAGKGG